MTISLEYPPYVPAARLSAVPIPRTHPVDESLRSAGQMSSMASGLVEPPLTSVCFGAFEQRLPLASVPLQPPGVRFGDVAIRLMSARRCSLRSASLSVLETAWVGKLRAWCRADGLPGKGADPRGVRAGSLGLGFECPADCSIAIIRAARRRAARQRERPPGDSQSFPLLASAWIMR